MNDDFTCRDAIYRVSDNTMNQCDDPIYRVSANQIHYERDAINRVSTGDLNSDDSIRYKNKYRIPSARLQGYDYSSSGAYFITICTKNRVPCFGKITDEKMQLSEIGKIAFDCWEQIPQHFPFVQLGEFVIMPNHMHGIVIIDDNDQINRTDTIHRVSENTNNNCTDAINRVSANQIHYERDTINHEGDAINHERDAINRVSTNAENKGGITKQNNPMLNKNLSTIIRWYKGRTTFEIRKLYPNFAWQSRFYDHIIRNEEEFYRISEYIINNPLIWEDDKYYA